MESLGTADFDFYDGLLTQLVNVGTQGKTPDERGTNFMLAMVRGIGPKDEIEAMMAAQMAAVHMTTMTFARDEHGWCPGSRRDTIANPYKSSASASSLAGKALHLGWDILLSVYAALQSVPRGLAGFDRSVGGGISLRF